MTKYAIIGGGIAGLSLASFLEGEVTLIERKPDLGGLSRSFDLNGVAYDIGPHIIFSRNKEVLDLHTSMIPVNRLRRSNQIVFKGNFIKYPFENDLSSLGDEDRSYCLNEFLNNPYESISPTNMLQFFLKTFGEGITRLYLQPYNEKIWKFDPSCLDMQMVERIPKPPREDVIASANGTSTEGYLHQLYFYYPTTGGFQSLVDAYHSKAEDRGHKIMNDTNIVAIDGKPGSWEIQTDKGLVAVDNIINTAPLSDFAKLMKLSRQFDQNVSDLLYNSIYIVMIQVRKDRIGEHFALYIPDDDILFHRLSKLDFLGDAYCRSDGGSTLMAEVTFRPDSHLASMRRDDVIARVVEGLVNLNFIDSVDVLATELRYEPYAYVIYDLDHRRRVDALLAELEHRGIRSVGRFAEFEYLNTDAVVEHSLALARELNGPGVPDPLLS